MIPSQKSVIAIPATTNPSVAWRKSPGFVAAHHGVDIGAAVKSVEQGEIAFAGNAKQPVDAVRHQAVDDFKTLHE